MEKIPPLKSVMTPFPWFATASSSLADAASTMERHDVRHLPVTEGDEVIGVVSRRGVEAHLAAGRGEEPVGEVCEPGDPLFDLNYPLDLTLSAMAERRLDAVVVVKDGKLAGIFTASDACRCFAEMLHRADPWSGGGGDDDIA